jgi:hypothetical protein
VNNTYNQLFKYSFFFSFSFIFGYNRLGLEFIESEIKKVEAQIETKQQEVESIGDEIATVQQSMQKEAAQAAPTEKKP